MFAKQELTHVEKMPIIPPDQVSLNMLGPDQSKLGQMTLESALSLIKPLTFLAQVPANSSLQYFQIKPLKAYHWTDLEHQRLYPKRYKRSGRSKEFHLTTKTPAGYLEHVLNKTCEYLLQGARIQFCLRQGHQKGRSAPSLEVALKTMPQFRPDTILRSMPEGTTMLAQPCIAPEARPKRDKLAGVDPPLLWAVELKSSLDRFGLHTPKRIKNMAKWNVEPEPERWEKARQVRRSPILARSPTQSHTVSPDPSRIPRSRARRTEWNVKPEPERWEKARQVRRPPIFAKSPTRSHTVSRDRSRIPRYLARRPKWWVDERPKIDPTTWYKNENSY